MNNYCNYCNHDCREGGRCKPAEYNGMFSIQVSPYDDLTWLVTWNGMTHKVRIPASHETDTKLSTDQSNATLNYTAEQHKDTITGSQLGDLINVDDLRNVDFDTSVPGTCYELVYRKYGSCGEGCLSVQNKWYNFNPSAEGAKHNALRYVRGANAYGCPEYLDVPTNLNQYWLTGWKTDGENKQFGYFQPEQVSTFPTDALGNYIVGSYDVSTKKPVYGSLPLQCLFTSLVASVGFDVFSTWSVVQSTPGFSATFNNMTGDFNIHWDDWRGAYSDVHVGSGNITGKANWTVNFNLSNGNMEYHINSIYFNTASWTVDQGAGGTGPIKLTLKGVAIPGGAETTLLNAYSYSGDASWTQSLNTTIPCDQTVTVAPNQTVGPFNFAYVFVDWLSDDEGYLQLNFKNKLAAWGC